MIDELWKFYVRAQHWKFGSMEAWKHRIEIEIASFNIDDDDDDDIG